VSGNLPRPWLEIGVGTGRFADALGIDIGVDPASGVLPYTKRRGVRTVRAMGHALPFNDGEFGAVFVIVTLCFADDAAQLLREAARVTRPDGGIAVGIVPARSPWGRFHASRGERGHIFYSQAKFYTLEQLRDLARLAELRVDRVVSTLFQRPGQGPFEIEHPREGEDRRAGFVAMLFRRQPQAADRTTRPSPANKGSEPPGPLICMKENAEINPDNPRCPYPSSQCQFRELCPVRDAMRSKRNESRQ
jgi:SAM-dependent methyltransferase